MTTAVVSEVDEALARLDAALDEVAALPLDACTDDEVLAVWRCMERHRRRQASVEHGVIARVQTRSLAFSARLQEHRRVGSAGAAHRRR